MVEICQKSNDNVLFGVCYRPPSADVEYSLKLRQCLEKIEMTRFATCYLVGDFNFPNTDWHSLTATSSDLCTVDFCDMLNDHFLVQCNLNPTRMLNETDGNILDLILTKTPDLVSDVEVLTDHFNSDHFPVSFNIKLLSGRPRKSVSRKNYNFKKADCQLEVNPKRFWSYHSIKSKSKRVPHWSFLHYSTTLSTSCT